MRKIFTLLVGCFLALSTSVAEAQDLWLDYGSGTAATGSYVDPANSDAGAFAANGLKYSNGVEFYLVKSGKTLSGGNPAKDKSKPIKLSNGAYNLILLPENFETQKIEIYGYCNSSGKTCSFSVYTENEDGTLTEIFNDAAQTLPYLDKNTFGGKTVDTMDKITCDIPKVSGRVWVKNAGGQPCVYFNIINANGETPGGPTTVVAHAWEDYGTPEAPVLSKIVYTNAAVTAGQEFFDGDVNISVTAPYAATNTSAYAKSFLGYDFAGSAQLGRINDKNLSETNLTGTERTGNSPLVVTPKTDLDLVVYIRRQALEQRSTTETDEVNNVITETHYWGMSANDGKSIYANAQANITEKLPQELIFGCFMNEEAKGENDYLTCAVVWKLEANQTYTIWTSGTTINMYAIGYILPEPEKPAVPQIFIGDAEHTGEEISLSEGDVVVKFVAADVNHNVYYNFTATEPAAPEAAPAREAAPTIEHEDETYTLAPAEGITLSENGTLKVLAHNPATGAKSDVVTRAVSGGTTAITEIEAAGSAEAVYYNLQGVKVENPAQGLYIRVQGGKAEKVVVK